MIKLKKILRESTEFALMDDQEFYDYLYAVGRWLTRGSHSEARQLMAAYLEVQDAVQKRLHSIYGNGPTTLYRALSFEWEFAVTWEKEVWPAKIGKIYNMQSFDGRTIFSWSDSIEGAQLFAKNQYSKGYIFQADIPTDMMMYSYSMYTLDEWRTHLISTGDAVEVRTFLKAYEKQEEEREITVWHRQPVDGTLVEMWQEGKKIK